jgi:hypothetical protein
MTVMPTTAQQDLIALAERLIRYFPKGTIDPLLDADIEIRQMAQNAIAKFNVQVLDSPAAAQQRQHAALLTALVGTPGRQQERITEDIAERQTNEEEARYPICPECLASLIPSEIEVGNMVIPSRFALSAILSLESNPLRR